MRRTLLLAFLALASCDDEPRPPADCTTPDFDVLITAVDGPLPADTVVKMVFGGGMDEYRLTDDTTDPENLFCTPSDREGNPVLADNGEGGRSAQAGHDGGAGGASSDGTVEGLRCDVWSDSSVTLTVTTSTYPVAVAQLQGKKGVCTVSSEIELSPSDGGT